MDLRDFLRLLTHNWVLIAVSILLGVVGGSTYVLLAPAEYTATSKAFVSTNASNSVSDFNQGTSALQQVVKSYAEVATTPYVLNSVIKQLHLDTTPARLANQITADAPTETVVLEVTATDASATRAAAIANSVTTNLSTAVARLTPDQLGSSAVVKVTQLQAATPPASPASPSLIPSIAVGFLLGAAAGVTAAMAREKLDTKIRNVLDVEAITTHAVLGRISYSPESIGRPIIDAQTQSARAEEYRTLRTNLQFVNFDSAAKVFIVTSSIAGEGKSTTVANLGVALASAGKRVLLVDGDLRKPMLGERFGLEASVGLTDVLIGEVDLDAASQTSQPNLDVLTSGPIPPNPSELLQSSAMVALLKTVRESYDVVIVDTPPLLPVTDAAIVAKLTDGAIVVSAVDRVRKPQLRLSLLALVKVEATILGVVPTMLPRRAGQGSAYGFGNYSAAASAATV